MEKRIMIRITFEKMTLTEAAEVEEKIADLLTKYPTSRVELTALSPQVLPRRPA